MKYKLGEICEIVSGSTPKTSVEEYWNGDIKWITPAELTDESLAKGITLIQLNMEVLREISLIVPPLEQQKAYVEFAKQVDKSKVAVQKSLDENQRLFDKLNLSQCPIGAMIPRNMEDSEALLDEIEDRIDEVNDEVDQLSNKIDEAVNRAKQLKSSLD